MKCNTKDCTKPAIGWAVLKTGGSTQVNTCPDHTDPKLIELLKGQNMAASSSASKSTSK
jgi:hypothetical protein